MHISTVTISQTLIDKSNITIAIKYKVACGLSISIDLTLAYCEGQLDCRNSVSPNFLAFLFKYATVMKIRPT